MKCASNLFPYQTSPPRTLCVPGVMNIPILLSSPKVQVPALPAFFVFHVFLSLRFLFFF